jgi:hypothetical protein
VALQGEGGGLRIGDGLEAQGEAAKARLLLRGEGHGLDRRGHALLPVEGLHEQALKGAPRLRIRHEGIGVDKEGPLHGRLVQQPHLVL